MKAFVDEPLFFEAREISSPIKPYEWPFARENAQEIAAHWRRMTTSNPALYDDPMFLCRNVGLSENVWRAEYFETSFSVFLAWRDFGFPDKNVFNGFAMAALCSMDGAWLLGRMGDHTANAGLCYFAAGTPDRNDVRAGEIDLDGSLARELLEETGFDVKEAKLGHTWTILQMGQRIACFRQVELTDSAQNLAFRAQNFIAQQHNSELSEMAVVNDFSSMKALDLPEFMRCFLMRAMSLRQ